MQFIDVFERYLSSFDESKKLTACRNHVVTILTKTAHISRATVVAKAIGFCYFNARLTGALGVTGIVLKEGLPGKGQNLHRIMGLAAADYCNDWEMGKIERIDSYIENAIDELETAGILEIRKEEEIQSLKNQSLHLLSWFARALPKLKETLDLKTIKCLSEVQIIDFKTRIWGVPDLIIEDKEQRKGIVIEWKSYPNVQKVDVIQSFVYSILEAIRLGYNDLLSLEEAIAPYDISNTKVANLIIRPTGLYSRHKALSSILGSKIAYYEPDYMRKLIRAILVMAYHFAILVAEPETYVGSRKALERVCSIERKYGDKTVKIQVHRYGPKEVFGIKIHRGYPMGRHDKYPCKVCPYSDTNSPLTETLGFGECRMYFGKLPGSEKTKFERLLWKFRFNVYKQSERSMLLYKGLHDASNFYGSIKEFIDAAKNGPLEVDENGDIKILDRESPCFNLRVNYNNSLRHEAKTVVDIYKIKYIFTATEGLVLSKPVKEVEVETREGLHTLCLPRERKPILVSFVEPHVTSITHAVGLFARIGLVAMPGEKIGQIKCDGNEVCLLITPISPYLRYPFHLFKRYYKALNLDEVIVTEVDADLTYIDLRTLHALQTKVEQAKLDTTQKEYLTKFLINALKSISERASVSKI